MQLPGERGFLRYIPLGVGAVIPPWNFPNAIALGMTRRRLVCGNTVVLKPSSDSPTIAAKFFEVLEEAGMPAGVVNFCPGSGATFGDGLVAHPKTRYIAFTGSRDVGLDITLARRAAPEGPDLDQAHGARNGRQGRDHRGCRCRSRCRRGRRGRGRVRLPGPEVLGLLARHRARGYLRRVPRETEGRARRRSRSALPEDNVRMGPVINEGAMKSILDYIEIGKQEGRLITGGERAPGDGYFIQPTVIADIDPMARLSQEEISARCWR